MSTILMLFHLSAKAQELPFVHHTERKIDSSFVGSSNTSLAVPDLLNRGTHESPELLKKNSLQDFFRKGTFFGHARYFLMATNNAEGLTDYYANAVGFGIGYETGRWHNFQLGISGYAIYHLASSDLTNVDALSNQPNRYELGLFDVEDPSNKTELDRLEDLYLKYSNQKLNIKLGKQHIRTPFLNPQDGRMRPTLVEGILFDYKMKANLLLSVGAVNKLSPRSTVHWYDVAESMGLYGLGVNPDGSKSQFKGNMPASVIVFGGIEKQWKRVKLKLWDQLVTNIFNSSLLQLEGSLPIDFANLRSHVNDLRFEYGVQWISQQSMLNGGNVDPNKSYFVKNNYSNVYGVRLGLNRRDKWKLTLNYTRITKEGRYLMPREWGRDPFFTFMPRERNEGYGDLHAANVVLSHQINGVKGLVADLSYGRFYLPDAKNFALNKYGFPAYQQVNLDLRYSFHGFIKGLELQGLVVFKDAIANTYALPKYEINKVNLTHFNLILNYHF